MDLIIVESPTKANTFNKYLKSNEYQVEATIGHVRDLPQKKIGIDLEHGFKPDYVLNEEKKETIETLKKNSREVKEGFRQIKKVISNFNVEITPVQEVLKKISETSDPLQKAMATLKNRDITHQALQELVLKPFQNPKKIGKLMNEHHLMLKKYLKISTPKIERMIKASLKAGAYGAKIHGSGLGGTMIAYAPGREKQVAKAIERVGGKATLVHQDRGVIT